MLITAFSLWSASAAFGQLKLDLDHLASKASESVNVTLDASTLALAGKFLSADKTEDARIKDTIAKLKAIQVRVFEFPNPGAYSLSDIQPVREQLKAPAWNRIVAVQEKNEGAEVYLKTDQGKPAGLAILAWEPKELVVVHLDGPVSLEDLVSLRGKFGIPDVPPLSGGKRPKK
jgi:hypothetical protein